MWELESLELMWVRDMDEILRITGRWQSLKMAIIFKKLVVKGVVKTGIFFAKSQ